MILKFDIYRFNPKYITHYGFVHDEKLCINFVGGEKIVVQDKKISQNLFIFLENHFIDNY